jgi:hypothetical protein
LYSVRLGRGDYPFWPKNLPLLAAIGSDPQPGVALYLTEKPAKLSYWPCADGLAKRSSGVLYHQPISVGHASGTVGEGRRFCVMESALKHKYKVGASVYFTASNVSRPAASGTYEVVRLLPTEGDDCQYRIKSSTEAFERVAKESQLALS